MEIKQKNDLIHTILSLPPLDRIEIIDKLLDGLTANQESDFDAFWAEESERRLDEFHNGSILTIPASEVFNKINDYK